MHFFSWLWQEEWDGQMEGKDKITHWKKGNCRTESGREEGVDVMQ